MVTASPVPDGGRTRGERLWQRIMTAAMALPGARVHRESFLRRQLANYVEPQLIERAVTSSPAAAGIPRELVDGLADACINSHLLTVSGASFAAGLPGGWGAAAALPLDVTQYFWHYVVIAQELAYLYGWPDFAESAELDSETENILSLLIAAGLGSRLAGETLQEISTRFAEQVAKRLPRQPLTHYVGYRLLKQMAKWLGFKVTKDIFAKGVGKVIPVVGGAMSAGVTYVTFRTSSRRLKKHLRGLRFALPQP